MKAYFAEKAKGEPTPEKKKPQAETPREKEEKGPAKPDTIGLARHLDALNTSIELAERSPRESADEEAAIDVLRFVRKHNERNDWFDLDRPAGMVKKLRQAAAFLQSPDIQAKLPHGEQLAAEVNKALSAFE